MVREKAGVQRGHLVVCRRLQEGWSEEYARGGESATCGDTSERGQRLNTRRTLLLPCINWIIFSPFHRSPAISLYLHLRRTRRISVYRCSQKPMPLLLTMFRWYSELFRKYPFRANMISTGVFFGSGDALAQHMFPHQDAEHQEFNYQRTARAMIYGSCFFAPLGVLWYGRKLPLLKNPFLSAKNRLEWLQKRVHAADILYRVGLDQLFVPALVWIPMYNVVMSTLAMHEHPLDVAADKLRNNWWKVLKANWTVWPIFQVVSFTLIPVHLRIVCANIWSVGWNCFLSFLHNTPGHGKGSGHLIEELVDIEDEAEEQTMVYS